MVKNSNLNLIERTNILSSLLKMLSDEGVSTDSILRGVEIKLYDPSDPRTCVSTRQLLDVIRRAIKLSRRPHLGLRFGLSVTLNNYGLYGLTMQSAPRLRNLLDFMTRYDKASDPIVRFVFSEEPAMAMVSFHPPCDRHWEKDLYVFLIEYALGVSLRCGYELLGTDWKISAIDLSSAEPADSRVYVDTFNCPINYGRPNDRILFHLDLLDRKPKQGFAPTFALMKGLYEGQFDQCLPSQAIEARIHAMMVERGTSSASFEKVSDWLGMSSRTLRRRLAVEGTSFRLIINRMRMEQAAKLLLETDLTIGAIAERLGYSDTSNFGHAFRAGMKTSPSDYRAKARQ
ncbi:AraC family transcriptional regulator [Labrys sp. KB_33_2]|uniref:AraC family transcriptional regulator n=1 Tax=Labrys sp. KB_33_2 TaxID=3237479 RepID=UPI003F8E5800